MQIYANILEQYASQKVSLIGQLAIFKSEWELLADKDVQALQISKTKTANTVNIHHRTVQTVKMKATRGNKNMNNDFPNQ